MNVLIVGEKPSTAKRIAPIARQYWPTAQISIVNANPYGNVLFKYPRGLKLSDFPFTSEPQNRLRPWTDWHCAPYAMDANGELSTCPMSKELFTSADLIVFACDPDHAGVVSFEILMREVFGDDRHLACPALMIFALDNSSLQKYFADMKPFGEVGARGLAYGRVKRYFDWNWNVNSLAILSETQRQVGVAAEAPPLSKYALQLLYGMRARPAMTDGQVITLMHRWPGTGRYQRARQSDGFFGSPASRQAIVVNLLNAGLLARSVSAGKEHLAVSELGHELLNRLHPDCEDADLSFRLDAWCKQGPAALPAIDRYIKTFFGKQKRFLTA